MDITEAQILAFIRDNARARSCSLVAHPYSFNGPLEFTVLQQNKNRKSLIFTCFTKFINPYHGPIFRFIDPITTVTPANQNQMESTGIQLWGDGGSGPCYVYEMLCAPTSQVSVGAYEALPFAGVIFEGF